jgi:hypothetical protein
MGAIGRREMQQLADLTERRKHNAQPADALRRGCMGTPN